MKRIGAYSFIITFFWLGFVSAISFMEAPVKFTAPTLTMPVGLDVGRIVFSALNKVEIALAVLSIICVFVFSDNKQIKLIFSFIVIILAIQTFWMLPALNERALLIINSETPPDSNVHLFYIIFETVKVILLFILGVIQIKYFKKIILNKAYM